MPERRRRRRRVALRLPSRATRRRRRRRSGAAGPSDSGGWRRLRPGRRLGRRLGRLRPRGRRGVVLVLVGSALVVALGVWLATTARAVHSDLEAAGNQARVVRSALADGDVERARRALDAFQRASDAAAERTDTLPWRFAERAPWLGDDAAALATVSDVLSELGRSGVTPLLDSADQITARAYAPVDGQFPLDSIAALEEPARQSHGAFEEAVDRLADHDPADLLGPLATAYLALDDQVRAGEEALQTAERAARLMPSFLGGEGRRHYLYVFQNNAEARSGGGLPGNLSLVRAERGEVDIVEQTSGAAFGRRDTPVLPLTPEETALYGTQLGTFFLDANFTPDLPRAAELWRARWEELLGGRVDGVFTVDPVVLSYLLEATGPIVVQGVPLDATTVVQTVESGVYLNQPDPALQDAFLNAVAKVAFDTFADGAGDPATMVSALVRGVAEGRIRLHSFVAADQAVVAGTDIAGELRPADETRPQVGVYVNDGTGSKMSYYLDYAVDVAAVDCLRGRQRLQGRLTITSDAPADAATLPEPVTGYDVVRRAEVRRGDQVVVLQVMAPRDGEVLEVVLDDERLEQPLVQRLDRRPVVPVTLVLAPGQTHELRWTMRSGTGQSGDVDVAVTPGRLPRNESSTAPSAC